MIVTPRCGKPVEYYELRRLPDPLDAVPRQLPCPDSGGDRTTPCFRPKGHAERETGAGLPVRHASEASYRRTLAQAVRRKRAWRARRHANNSGG